MTTEHSEQIALFQRARYNNITRDYMFAIENGGTRHPIEAVNIQRRGVKRGVPDIFLAYPSFGYHGLFIEMKRPAPQKGKLTADQVIWLARLKDIGYESHVAYGWEDAWSKIQDYLQINIDITSNI